VHLVEVVALDVGEHLLEGVVAAHRHPPQLFAQFIEEQDQHGARSAPQSGSVLHW
jgi:hypothetical protein